MVNKHFSDGGEDNDDGELFPFGKFSTIQRDILSDSIRVQSFLKCCKFNPGASSFDITRVGSL